MVKTSKIAATIVLLCLSLKFVFGSLAHGEGLQLGIVLSAKPSPVPVAIGVGVPNEANHEEEGFAILDFLQIGGIQSVSVHAVVKPGISSAKNDVVRSAVRIAKDELGAFYMRGVALGSPLLNWRGFGFGADPALPMIVNFFGPGETSGSFAFIELESEVGARDPFVFNHLDGEITTAPLVIGNDGSGDYHLSGGVLNIVNVDEQGRLILGKNINSGVKSFGRFAMTDGALNVDGGAIGGEGDAEFLISGGIAHFIELELGGADAPKISNALFDQTGGRVFVRDVVSISGNKGELNIFGEGAVMDVSGDVFVGDGFNANTPGGALTVGEGGRLIVGGTLFVEYNGVLSGEGGVIQGDVVVGGGAISPGSPPGSMTINGDLSFSDSPGMLLIDVTTANAELFDELTVTDDLAAPDGFTLVLSFLNGFRPSPGDAFNFLHVDGRALTDLSRINLVVEGLDSDLDIQLTRNGGVFSFSIIEATPGVAPSPADLP